MEAVWEWIKRVSALFGFITVVALVLDFFGVLPFYDISYRKKTDITPTVYMFPGANLRLSAEFARAVELRDIERVTWKLEDGSGRKHTDLPQLKEIDIQLLPDFSGILSINVNAKVRGETAERSGGGSIQIAQTKPRKVDLQRALLPLSPEWDNVAPDTVQVYAGANQWSSVARSAVTQKPDRLLLEGTTLPIWDGKAFLRYKRADDPAGPYRYETAIAMSPKEGA